ncbi:MAG: sodium:proton antiporter [Ignavibacteriae bacterium]|nr:sodium:proton antiporter [Ignavibacteriota bacterium]
MNKTFLTFFILLLSVNAQTLDFPSINLNDVPFKITIKNYPDSLKSVSVNILQNEKNIQSILFDKSSLEKEVTVNLNGNFQISSNEIKNLNGEFRVIPGWLSIIPPLLAILLALLLRQVIVALTAGIVIGAFFIYDFNFFIALLRFVDTIMIDTLVNRENSMIIVFTLLFGGVIGIISKNGGTVGISNLVTKLAKTAKSGMLSSWLMGLFIFFDDYANTLIIGNMMRPITDRLRISREKLAYLVDSTSAPVASIFIISSWIGFELGLIATGLRSVNSDINSYELLLQTIPYRFYPIAALFFVFLVAYTQRDFGPMYKAEVRARTTGKLFDNKSIESNLDDDSLFNNSDKAKWYNGAVPILVILFGTIAGLIYTGILNLTNKGITDFGLREIIINSDSFLALMWAGFAASVTAVIMSIGQKILSLNEAINAWTKGVQSMLFACIILAFAWAISDVTEILKTADYLISILSDSLDPRLLPVLVFLVCAAVSFSTGTSWGTMAIVMPIVIPLSFKMAELHGLNFSTDPTILAGVVSSVLAGSVFGDHCSPIADTTILSSMASHCNHIDHVKTQLPYAIVVGVVCMILGDLATAYGLPTYIAIPLIFFALYLIIRFFGKKVSEAVV